MIVRSSPELLVHLSTHEVDGTTVGAALFEGGRLHYPERRRLEYELGFTEPYTLEHEARVIDGMDTRWNSACVFLARVASRRHGESDPTLTLLWECHTAFAMVNVGAAPALDRLIAALVTVNDAMGITRDRGRDWPRSLVDAVTTLLVGLQTVGLPPSSIGMEEICDGAPPACVGLGLVDVDWRERG